MATGNAMTRYLLIESLDPFESRDAAHYWDLAANLARTRTAVTLFLVQNGALAARRGAGALGRLAEQGVEVLVDEFSLRERGISRDDLAAGVRAAPLDVVVDRLAEGWKALWH
jgi:intracellular sulfur oxidation DsrE/DsrF family protein